jgi:hypothetical protein
MSANGPVVNDLAAQTVSAKTYALSPLLQTTRPFAPPGGLAGQVPAAGDSQLAKGNLGGVHATAGIGVTTDNVA